MGCEFHFDAALPVPAVVLVRARQDGGVTVERETWHVQPNASFSDLVDTYGNPARRVVIGAGTASLRYDAAVTTSAALDEFSPGAGQRRVEDLPGETLFYMLASRYCLSDVLADAALDLFGTTPLGWERVQAACNWVHDNVRFDYGASGSDTTSVEVFEAKAGVCRDFAHLAISFCRALNIPARYVFGYLPDIEVTSSREPMDFCAWMEVYLGGRWWTFDPRNNARRIGRVVIARCRDAMDLAMATSYGTLLLEEMTVWADEIISVPATLDHRYRLGEPVDLVPEHVCGPQCDADTLRVDFLDHDAVDWSPIRRTVYQVQQRFRYQYAAPISDLRQRLVVVPRPVHGNQRLLSHRLEVSVTRFAKRMHGHRFGKVVLEIKSQTVEEAVDFDVSLVVERSAGPGPHLEADTGQALGVYLPPTARTRPNAALRGAAGELACSGEKGADLAAAVSSWGTAA